MTARTAMPPIAAEKPTIVTVQIGNFRREYKLFQTNASQRLDYSYVLTLVEDNGIRWILIPPERAAYQLGRYGSDLAWAVPSDIFDADDISEKLYQAMIKPFTDLNAE